MSVECRVVATREVKEEGVEGSKKARYGGRCSFSGSLVCFGQARQREGACLAEPQTE